ncbi:MAG: L-2-amino-thiazoline-4-carboxylic acid hydrolase [Lachnospiraceae bacterium]|nr:L-2-amino-thiazoline-4-carboxylic acid hydrolase [Lachnospiraceae bacterium]
MIKNEPTKSDPRTDLQRSDFEHRAIWCGMLVQEAQKKGLDTSFAHEAIKRCGVFHGNNKYPRTDDLKEFAPAFATVDVMNTFEMEIKESSDEKLSIDFHYCPLVSGWKKVGIPEDEIAELCEIAMDGDRGIISTYPKFSFELGKTIAKGDDVCEIRISKHD